jgi:hypothetical protein
MVDIYIHTGSIESITISSSPGFLFLKEFLAALDSLTTDEAAIFELVEPEATFIINGGSEVGVKQLTQMLGMRGKMLANFGHRIHTAWDIRVDDLRRTVIYESTSFTVFKEDPDALEVEVKEFNAMELVVVAGEAGKTSLKVKLHRTYMDSTPVTARVALIRGNNTNTE